MALGLTASDEKCIATVEALIAAGADIESRDSRNSGWTPLMSAAYANCPKVVELLIEKGAKTQVRDERGRTVFRLILSQDYSYNEVLKILVARTTEGQRWLQSDDGRAWQAAERIDPGLPMPAPYAEVNTVLEAAITSGNVSPIIHWVESGGNLNWSTPNGWTLLHIAAKCGNKDMVRFLLERGANIEARDKRNETPLIIACNYGWIGRKVPDVVVLLLDRGADPNAVDCDGKTALDHIRVSRNDEAREIASVLERRASTSANLQRWKLSGEPESWVRARLHGWNHQDWLDLIGLLRASQYWPMDPNAVGRYLEQRRAQILGSS